MKEIVKSFPENTELKAVHIWLAGVTYPDPNKETHLYRIKNDSLTLSNIEFIVDGEGYVICQGEKHHVTKDMVYFLKEGDNCDYYCDPNNPYTKIFINVLGNFSNQLISAYNLKNDRFFYAPELKPLFKKIIKIITSKKSDEEMQSELQGVFMEILFRLSLIKSKEQHSGEAVILKSYIDSRIDKIITAEDMAKKIFRSKDYCLKLFKKEYGVTPYAYQLYRKIHSAKVLLAGTTMPVGEVAESLGYKDMHYFSNIFYKKCGMRPSEYRKLKRK